MLECLSLFLIVLIHEFGHQLACRSVGGKTSDIVLWPLGGVAYVSPPQRPGAQLWSIAAGPLVNVILFPILSALLWLGAQAGGTDTVPDWFRYLNNVWVINLVLLIFNMMPVYPLDGGQILRSLLWFVFGQARSLMIATSIGFVGVAGLIAYAVWAQSIWLGIMCGLHSHELLGRIDAGARDGENGECAAPRGVCLPGLQNRAAAGRHLALRQMPPAVRHI